LLAVTALLDDVSQLLQLFMRETCINRTHPRYASDTHYSAGQCDSLCARPSLSCRCEETHSGRNAVHGAADTLYVPTVPEFVLPTPHPLLRVRRVLDSAARVPQQERQQWQRPTAQSFSARVFVPAGPTFLPHALVSASLYQAERVWVHGRAGALV
jgi:hypothetical protein